MPLLENAAIVIAIIDQSTDIRRDAIVTRIRVQLRNGWLMDCRERSEQRGRLYSFQVFADSVHITRWDNSPYHKRDLQHLSFSPTPQRRQHSRFGGYGHG